MVGFISWLTTINIEIWVFVGLLILTAKRKKNAEHRILCGICGFLGAFLITMGLSLGLDPFRCIRQLPAAEASDYLGSLGSWLMYLLGGFFGAAGLVFLLACLGLSMTGGRRYDTSDSTRPSDTATPTREQFNALGQRYGLVAAMQNEQQYHGWYMADSDNGGEPDSLYENSRNIDLSQLHASGLLYGNPGSGLNASDFGSDAVTSGQRGELGLARIIAHEQLPVLSFWSLYGMDDQGRCINADIDCVLLGIDADRRVHAWFVDAKNYKGGSDTSYVNVNERCLARISRSRRAFVKGSDGKPYITMSRNMAMQRERWQATLTRQRVDARWMVCMVPGGRNGTPDVSDAKWVGGIAVTSPQELIASVRAANLIGPNELPSDVVDFFRGRVKQVVAAA